MAELGGRQLCAFDPASGELYAAVSADNRLRIWNTVRMPLAAAAAVARTGVFIVAAHYAIHTHIFGSKSKTDSPLGVVWRWEVGFGFVCCTPRPNG